MLLKPIINSLLQNDMYKFTMGQVIFHQFQSYIVDWEFHCRNENVYFTKEMVEEIREQVKHYCALSFTQEELAYLNSILWIK